MSEFGAGGLNIGAAYFALGKILTILNLFGVDVVESYVGRDLDDPSLFRWHAKTVAVAPAYVKPLLEQVGKVKAFTP